MRPNRVLTYGLILLISGLPGSGTVAQEISPPTYLAYHTPRHTQELERQRQLEEERRRRQEEERRRQQQEAQRRAQEDARRRAQQEEQRWRQQEAQRQAQQRAQQEAQRRAQEEAQRRAQQEAQRQAQQRAQQETQRQAQQEAQRQAQQRAQQEAQRRAQEEAQRRAQQEAQQRAQAEAQRRAQEEAQRRAQQEAQRARASSAAPARPTPPPVSRPAPVPSQPAPTVTARQSPVVSGGPAQRVPQPTARSVQPAVPIPATQQIARPVQPVSVPPALQTRPVQPTSPGSVPQQKVPQAPPPAVIRPSSVSTQPVAATPPARPTPSGNLLVASSKAPQPSQEVRGTSGLAARPEQPPPAKTITGLATEAARKTAEGTLVLRTVTSVQGMTPAQSTRPSGGAAAAPVPGQPSARGTAAQEIVRAVVTVNKTSLLASAAVGTSSGPSQSEKPAVRVLPSGSLIVATARMSTPTAVAGQQTAQRPPLPVASARPPTPAAASQPRITVSAETGTLVVRSKLGTQTAAVSPAPRVSPVGAQVGQIATSSIERAVQLAQQRRPEVAPVRQTGSSVSASGTETRALGLAALAVRLPSEGASTLTTVLGPRVNATVTTDRIPPRSAAEKVGVVFASDVGIAARATESDRGTVNLGPRQGGVRAKPPVLGSLTTQQGGAPGPQPKTALAAIITPPRPLGTPTSTAIGRAETGPRPSEPSAQRSPVAGTAIGRALGQPVAPTQPNSTKVAITTGLKLSSVGVQTPTLGRLAAIDVGPKIGTSGVTTPAVATTTPYQPIASGVKNFIAKHPGDVASSVLDVAGEVTKWGLNVDAVGRTPTKWLTAVGGASAATAAKGVRTAVSGAYGAAYVQLAQEGLSLSADAVRIFQTARREGRMINLGEAAELSKGVGKASAAGLAVLLASRVEKPAEKALEKAAEKLGIPLTHTLATKTLERTFGVAASKAIEAGVGAGLASGAVYAVKGVIDLTDVLSSHKVSGRDKAAAVIQTVGGTGIVTVSSAVGASAGAALGTILLPGIGTAIGSAVGGAAGSITGEWLAESQKFQQISRKTVDFSIAAANKSKAIAVDLSRGLDRMFAKADSFGDRMFAFLDRPVLTAVR